MRQPPSPVAVSLSRQSNSPPLMNGVRPEQVQQVVGFAHFALVAIAGEVGVRGLGLAAETTPSNLAIERSEEQVLQHGAVVGISAIAVVVMQQGPDSRFIE